MNFFGDLGELVKKEQEKELQKQRDSYNDMPQA